MMTNDRPSGPKVLFLSALQIHPAYTGGHLRSYGLVNALRRHGLDVFVYSLAGRRKDYLALHGPSVQQWPEGTPEYVDRGPLGFLIQYASHALALPPVWRTAYLRAAASSPREILLPAFLREKLRWCDAIVADFPFVHPIFTAPSARGRLRVLSTHNVEHRLHDRAVWHKRGIRATVRDIELAAAEACDVLVSCCADDAEFFAANARVRRSVVVPNGIDMRRFRGIGVHRSRVRQELGIADDVKVFLFTASRGAANREAFEFLVEFSRKYAGFLRERKIHILVVGGVTTDPMRLPSFTATGRVPVVEPYFAAADAGLNPLSSGAGTNLKTCEYIAVRLPVVTTRFGARGYVLQEGASGFLFEKDALAPVLSRVRRLFDRDPSRLRRIADEAYLQNETAIDMDACARVLADAMTDARPPTACLPSDQSTERARLRSRRAEDPHPVNVEA